MEEFLMGKFNCVVPCILLGVVGVLSSGVYGQSAKSAPFPEAGALELKKLEESAATVGPVGDSEKTLKKDKVSQELLKMAKPQPPVAPSAKPGAKGIKVGKVAFEGDLMYIEKLGLVTSLRSALEGKSHPRRDIANLLTAANKELIDQGYYASRIIPTYPAVGSAELHVKVDIGRVGTIMFYQKPEGVDRGATFELQKGARTPYGNEGWYSTAQLTKTVQTMLEPGMPFNYNDLKSSVLRLNSQPDLTLDADLKIRADENTRQRMIDLDFYVNDNSTYHGVLELNNTGTEETEDLRLFATFQKLNATKHDDMLTLTVPVSFPDVSVLHSFSLGYNLPYSTGKGGAVSAFGGYSRLDVKEIQDELGLQSDGLFGGARAFYRLYDSRQRTITISFGGVYRSVSDAFVFGDAAPEDRKVEVAPFSMGLAYTEKEPGFLRGRSFASALSIFNAGGTFGITDEENMQVQRLGADPDYFIQKFQFARLQPLGGHFDETDNQMKRQWVLFARLDLQYADGSLIPSEQMAAGGMESVRGYPERDVSGDLGVIASLELRTPVFSGLLTSVKPGARIGGSDIDDKIQFVSFVDGGYVQRNEQFAEIAERDFSLLSLGVGMRYSFTQYAQMRLDYGYPLQDTETQAFKDKVDGTGRLHFSLQGQF
jgi:hemolysin activation/secretion protein